jgi:hypothetical protein
VANRQLGEYEPFRGETNFDQISLNKAPSGFSSNSGAYIRSDGTIWFFDTIYETGKGTQLQKWKVDAETNWVSLTTTWESMIALKADGTLWRWDLNFLRNYRNAIVPPARLGIHNDWVALTRVDGGTVSLAADGSLWLWPNPRNDFMMMKLPKQPKWLANVFDAEMK